MPIPMYPYKKMKCFVNPINPTEFKLCKGTGRVPTTFASTPGATFLLCTIASSSYSRQILLTLDNLFVFNTFFLSILSLWLHFFLSSPLFLVQTIISIRVQDIVISPSVNYLAQTELCVFGQHNLTTQVKTYYYTHNRRRPLNNYSK